MAVLLLRSAGCLLASHKCKHAPAEVLARIGNVAHRLCGKLVANLCGKVVVRVGLKPVAHGQPLGRLSLGSHIRHISLQALQRGELPDAALATLAALLPADALVPLQHALEHFDLEGAAEQLQPLRARLQEPPP